MVKSVLTMPQAFGMTFAVYAGSSQLAVLPLFAAKLPLWTILLTAACCSAISMAISVFEAEFPDGLAPGKEAFFWGMALFSWTSRQISSVLGILLASVIPDNWGLELAGTLALIPLIVSAVATRSTAAAVAVASVVALLAFDRPYRFGLPLAAVVVPDLLEAPHEFSIALSNHALWASMAYFLSGAESRYDCRRDDRVYYAAAAYLLSIKYAPSWIDG